MEMILCFLQLIYNQSEKGREGEKGEEGEGREENIALEDAPDLCPPPESMN
jgi:hypothetical protein